MSEYQTAAIKGSFWENGEKETDKHPDYKGSVILTEDLPAGTKLWFAAWGPNKGDSGKTYYSMRFQVAKAKKASETYTAARKPADHLQDDQIPFN